MVRGSVQPPLLQVDHAEVAEVGGLPTEPSDPLIEREGSVVVVGGLGQPPRPRVGDAELAQGGRLALEPAGLPVERQRPRVVLDGLPVPAQAQVEVGQAELRGALGLCPALGFRGGHRRLGDRRPVDDVHALPEVAMQSVGQQPCRRSRPVLGGVLDGGDQV